MDTKRRNFRISKQKLHDILTKQYGQEVITTFFELQALEDFDGILKMIKLIIESDPKLSQLLAFLTLDYNQDGIITEDELTKLSNMISIGNSMYDDINILVKYAK